MIPKIIHYCWFGRGEKPSSTLRYIDAWRRIMPDYQFVEWNEDNFDIHICPYVEQAYEARIFAFVSDYARGHALFDMGGIYLDTDVEVLKPFDDLLGHRSIWGFEAGDFIATSTIGAEPGHEFIQAYLDYYQNRHFANGDGSFDKTSNVRMITKFFKNKGLILDGTEQTLGEGNLFFPECFFSPYDYQVGRMAKTDNSYAIHHYGKSWHGPWAKLKGQVKKVLSRIRR